MPTTATYAYNNHRLDPYRNPAEALASMTPVPIKASSTLARGTVLGQVTATGRYAAYASGATDGTQKPVGILQYDVVTDSAGLITNQSEWGGTNLETPMFTQGTFLVSELTGLDATAVAALQGKYEESDANATIFSFG